MRKLQSGFRKGLNADEAKPRKDGIYLLWIDRETMMAISRYVSTMGIAWDLGVLLDEDLSMGSTSVLCSFCIYPALSVRAL